MANQVRVGTFIYRINPDNDKEMQRRSIGGNSWSRVAEFNGNHILDLLLAEMRKTLRFILTGMSICGNTAGLSEKSSPDF